MKVHLLALSCAVLFCRVSSAQKSARLGDVIICKVAKGCTEEVSEGRHFYVLTTELYRVRVAMQPEAKYNRAELTIENRSTNQVRFNPTEFRIESLEPKFTRLSYVQPATLKLPRQRFAKPVRPAAGSSFMAAKPKESTANGDVILLADSKLEPDESATGRVYFERSGSAHAMSLIVPICGTIFEFPYLPAK